MENTSRKWSLNSIDFKKWLKNTLIFLSPLGVIYIGFVINNVNNDGLSLSDFKINQIVAGAMVLYVLNVLFDLFTKFAKNN